MVLDQDECDDEGQVEVQVLQVTRYGRSSSNVLEESLDGAGSKTALLALSSVS